MKTKFISEEDKIIIRDLWEQGYTKRKIEEMTNIERHAVGKFLRENNIDVGYIRKTEMQKIINDFSNGMSINALYKKHGYAEITIKKALLSSGVDLVYCKYKIDEKTRNEICMLYQSNVDLDVIVKKYNFNRLQIKEILELCNVRIDNEYKKSNQIYTLNKNYFDDIDTPNKAYILGLLYADGNVGKNNDAIVLSLQDRDKHILEEIKKEIDTNRPLLFTPKRKENFRDSYTLRITDSHMKGVLISIGMIPNKSLTVAYPTVITNDLHRHFIRGLLDGDGCINKPYGKNGHNCNVYISGSVNVCTSLKNIIEDKLQVNCHLIKQDNILRMTISGRRQVVKFLDWIYQDSDLKLMRKYNTYINHYKE